MDSCTFQIDVVVEPPPVVPDDDEDLLEEDNVDGNDGETEESEKDPADKSNQSLPGSSKNSNSSGKSMSSGSGGTKTVSMGNLHCAVAEKTISPISLLSDKLDEQLGDVRRDILSWVKDDTDRVGCYNLLQEMELADEAEASYKVEDDFVLRDGLVSTISPTEVLPMQERAMSYKEALEMQPVPDTAIADGAKKRTPSVEEQLVVNKTQKKSANWGPTFGTRQSSRSDTGGATIMELAQRQQMKKNLEIPKAARPSVQDMVDHLKDYKKMGDPFQGIDDGLGGKILPSLPLSGKKNSGDRGLDAISGVADDWAKLDISGSKARLFQTAAQLLCSPTSTLEPLEQTSPPSPEVIMEDGFTLSHAHSVSPAES